MDKRTQYAGCQAIFDPLGGDHMPRYFFEVERTDIVFDDNVGADYPSDDAALRGGRRLAEELGRDAPELVGDILKIVTVEKKVLGRIIIMPPKERLQ